MATAAPGMTIMKILGGREGVGRQLRDADDLAEAIRAGLPAKSATSLARHLGLSRDETARVLGMAPRTLHRRIDQQARLTPTESDRAARVAQILADATEVLGSADGAADWIRTPNMALRGEIPLEQLDTEPGTQEVRAVLGRIAFGGYS